MRRGNVLAGGAVMLALAAWTVIPAGAGPTEGDFTINPTTGVAGTQHQITASDADGGCNPQRLEPAGFGTPITLGTLDIDVQVTLWTPGKTAVIDQEIDFTPQDGWSVLLTLPGTHPPGSYPISAVCRVSQDPTSEYNDQTFVLTAPPEDSEPPTPVQGEVDFTG